MKSTSPTCVHGDEEGKKRLLLSRIDKGDSTWSLRDSNDALIYMGDANMRVHDATLSYKGNNKGTGHDVMPGLHPMWASRQSES